MELQVARHVLQVNIRILLLLLFARSAKRENTPPPLAQIGVELVALVLRANIRILTVLLFASSAEKENTPPPLAQIGAELVAIVLQENIPLEMDLQAAQPVLPR